MTALEWINQNTGKYLDFDRVLGDQCVDEVQYYNRDIVGGPFLVGDGAVDIWQTYPEDFYDRIDNTPENAPQLGDIVIWSRDLNRTVGHIAVAISGDKDTFDSLDQNWSKGAPCTVITHNYNFVLGWLRPKNQQTPPPQQSGGDDMPLTDQTKFNFGDPLGELELGSVRSMLLDDRRDIRSLNDSVNQLKETVSTLTINHTTIADLSTRELFNELLNRILGR